MALNTLDFIRRVLPWPSDDQKGFINVHFAGVADDGHPWMSGKPTNTPQQFLEQVYGLNQWKKPVDIYFCLSRQSSTRTTTKGAVAAAKSSENALALKALWLDVDVGKFDKDGKPTAYATRDEAATAVEAFRIAAGMPPISAMVGSGGGLHVYWISDRELTPVEWSPYAHGFKALILKHGLFGCDAMVTADSARILRVPGTFNRKKDPPRPVELLELLDNDYDFATALAFLRDVDAGGTTLTLPAAERLEGAPLAAFAGLTGRLGVGIEHEEWVKNLDYVAPQCGFIREALETGGANFDQTLWNYTTLLSTWSKGGREDAHRMARGYPRYSEDETDQLYNRKLGERSNKHLGPPRCSAIQAAGCTACSSCPLLAANNTPLHYERVPVPPNLHVAPSVSGPVGPGAHRPTPRPGAPVGLIDEDLPFGYCIRDGLIHAVSWKPVKGGDQEPVYHPLFHCTLHEPWTHKEGDTGHALNFMVSTDGKNFVDCSLKMGDMDAGSINRTLLKMSVAPVQKHIKLLGDFFVNWINKLHAAGESRQATRLGWVQDPETAKVTGFNYGGFTYYPDGTRGKASLTDPEMRAKYTPRGMREPWDKCCKAVTDQHRPGLEVLVAVGFASPLMAAAGQQYNGTVCAVGEGGTQKSSAARTGLAVWQNPKIAKETPDSSPKSVLNRMGQVRNLPILWDEIQDATTNAKMFATLFTGTLGVEGGRLTSDVKQQARGDWQLMTMICTNNSFADYVAQRNPNNYAGLSRVLEWRQTPIADDNPGKMSMADADVLFGTLDDNYGRTGEAYAQYLIMNWDTIRVEVTLVIKMVESDLAMQPFERNWATVIGTILVGARLANDLFGCDFHVDEIKAHLYDTVRVNRERIKTEIHSPDSIDNVNDMLTAFLKAQSPHTLVTIQSTLSPGKVETAARPDHNRACQVQWDMGSGELRISKARFREWAVVPVDKGGAGLNARTAVQSLTKVFGATERRWQLGVGTHWVHNQEYLIIIPMATNPVLMSMMTGLAGKPDLPPGATPDNPGGFNAT
jgi:hypothetical protein